MREEAQSVAVAERERPVFAVDIDNVLADAEREVQRIYTKITHQPWPRSMFASAGGLDRSSFEQSLLEKIFDDFHETSIPALPTMPGAKTALQLLHHHYRIVIITARRPSSRPQTLTWLQAQQLPFDELYHTDEKAEVEENIVLAVDDHPEHALRYCEEGIPLFLMDQPWNQGVTHPLMTRVAGWDALVHTLHGGRLLNSRKTIDNITPAMD